MRMLGAEADATWTWTCKVVAHVGEHSGLGMRNSTTGAAFHMQAQRAGAPTAKSPDYAMAPSRS
jgi:hypothetical protein